MVRGNLDQLPERLLDNIDAVVVRSVEQKVDPTDHALVEEGQDACPAELEQMEIRDMRDSYGHCRSVWADLSELVPEVGESEGLGDYVD